MPRRPYTYITSPEQSNPAGVAPPQTYGTPRNRSASATACEPIPLPTSGGRIAEGKLAATAVVDGTPAIDASAARSCGSPRTAAARLIPVGRAARARPTRTCVPGASPTDGSETYARSATRPEPWRPGDTASWRATR